MTGLPAHLPDARVGVLATLGRPIDDPPQEPPLLLVDRPRPGVPDVRRVDQVAVDVELGLRGRRVAHPHGPRAPPPLEVELDLGQAPLAVGPVHDLELVGIARAGAHHEIAEALGDLAMADLVERLQGERRVPHPAVAVVPVRAAAHDLGQGGRGSRHDGAGRSAAEPLEHHRRPHQEIAPGALRPGRLRPPPPPPRRLLQPRRHLGHVGGAGVEQVGGLRDGGHGRRPSGGHRRATDHAAALAVDAQIAIRVEHQGVVAPHRARAPVVQPQPGARAAVVEARLDDDVDLRRALDPLDAAQELGAGVGASAAAHGEGIDHPHRAVRGRQGRLEDHRARPVAAFGSRDRGRRANREVPAALGVEQAREGAAAVEPAQARPIDGALATDQRRRVAVRQERVVPDRPIGGISRHAGGSPSGRARRRGVASRRWSAGSARGS